MLTLFEMSVAFDSIDHNISATIKEVIQAGQEGHRSTGLHCIAATAATVNKFA